MFCLDLSRGKDLATCLDPRVTSLMPVVLETPDQSGWGLLVCSPLRVFRSRGGVAWFGPPGDEKRLAGAPRTELARLLAHHAAGYSPSRHVVPALGMEGAFRGGWVGYFAYECGAWFEDVPTANPSYLDADDCWLGLYDTFVLRQPGTDVRGVFSLGLDPETLRCSSSRASDRAHAMAERLAPRPPVPVAGCDAPAEAPRLTPTTSREDFIEAVERCREYIRAGDVFQANLSQRFEIALETDGPALFRRLFGLNPSPYAGYLDTGRMQIVSGSPENLVTALPGAEGPRVITRPIAGTYPRDPDHSQDTAHRDALRADPKEQAEHVMLVDLERSDLGRICQPGTVTVDELMGLETYRHVHHLVSTVSGRGRPGISPIDILAALFPGGTITGAPKIRAMQIIDELENFQRGPYTGSMGYIGLDGTVNLSILIRTLVLQQGKAHLQVGAGIVADSDPDREHQETLHKARSALEALGFEPRQFSGK